MTDNQSSRKRRLSEDKSSAVADEDPKRAKTNEKDINDLLAAKLKSNNFYRAFSVDQIKVSVKEKDDGSKMLKVESGVESGFFLQMPFLTVAMDSLTGRFGTREISKTPLAKFVYNTDKNFGPKLNDPFSDERQILMSALASSNIKNVYPSPSGSGLMISTAAVEAFRLILHSCIKIVSESIRGYYLNGGYLPWANIQQSFNLAEYKCGAPIVEGQPQVDKTNKDQVDKVVSFVVNSVLMETSCPFYISGVKLSKTTNKFDAVLKELDTCPERVVFKLSQKIWSEVKLNNETKTWSPAMNRYVDEDPMLKAIYMGTDPLFGTKRYCYKPLPFLDLLGEEYTCQQMGKGSEVAPAVEISVGKKGGLRVDLVAIAFNQIRDKRSFGNKTITFSDHLQDNELLELQEKIKKERSARLVPRIEGDAHSVYFDKQPMQLLEFNNGNITES